MNYAPEFMTNTPTIPQKKRLEWLDAMRGFTMILVVSVHVSSYTYEIPLKLSSVQDLITLFRMPMFFFVSGFLAYKSSIQWDGKTLGSSLLKKVRVQLIPTLVFLFVYEVYKHHDYIDNFIRSFDLPRKNGYWFTWVLLLMFIAYYLFAFLEQKLQNSFKQKFMTWLPITVFFILSLCLYETVFMPKQFTYPKEQWADTTSFNLFAEFFCFFVLGNICRRFWKQAEKLFDSSWFFPLLIVLVIVCTFDFCYWHNLKFEWRNLPRTIDIIALLGIVLLTFRHYEHTFSKETRIGRALQYIGTRTLDIYLIHYFFLPTIPCVGEFFTYHRPNIVPELVVTMGTALIVIAFSCVTSAVLRTSPFLKKYLFGKES